MRHQKIEETFRAVNPRQRGVPAAPAISVGVSSSGDGFSGSLSAAAQEIAQLRAVYQAQADLITANTKALEKGSGSGRAGGSFSGGIGGMAKDAAQKTLGSGLLGILPLISGIASLFGGGKSEPAALPVYVSPPSIAIDSTIRNTSAEAAAGAGGASSPMTTLPLNTAGGNSLASLVQNDWSRSRDGQSTMGEQLMRNAQGVDSFVPNVDGKSRNSIAGSAPGSSPPQTTFSPQVTVNVHAMDSQSFLDRSSDIADAVRHAVLNLHPLNSVLAEL